jgi:hypothetical protein
VVKRESGFFYPPLAAPPAHGSRQKSGGKPRRGGRQRGDEGGRAAFGRLTKKESLENQIRDAEKYTRQRKPYHCAAENRMTAHNSKPDHKKQNAKRQKTRHGDLQLNFFTGRY